MPDLSTLRVAAWAERTAFVLCDVIGPDSHVPVPVAPRSILRRQVEALAERGLEAFTASELEFFIYRDDYRTAHEKGYRDLKSAGWYVEDYHLLQPARTEDYVGAARRVLRKSGIPVENSKGEAAIGQHELNVRYTTALAMADRHVVMKQAMKELADAQGISVSFMAKPHATQPGSSCHIHLSLMAEGRNIFVDEDDDEGGLTDEFRWFLAGWMHYVPDFMVFYAPTINSYKRYQDASWAPTSIAWSRDNRTVGFRIVGNGASTRIECRIPGADVNPYLAYAAALASGLDGIANQIELPQEFCGDADSAAELPRVPATLSAATRLFRESEATRRLLGDEVVEHYSHFFAKECEAFERAVTDWELERYFERI